LGNAGRLYAGEDALHGGRRSVNGVGQMADPPPRRKVGRTAMYG
jgi:hypothetical protein